MTVWMKHACILAVTTGFLFAQGCDKQDHADRPTDAAVEIVCSQLYQGTESLADALAFIEVPEDRMASSLTSVSRRGTLADTRQLAFANRLFSLRENKDVELFKSLLSDATRKELDSPDDYKQMVHELLRKVEAGSFLYGESDAKFFATFHRMTQDELDLLCKHVTFGETPTHSVSFYHWHKPKYMLIGTRVYLIEDGESYRIVTGRLLQGELPAPTEEKASTEPKTHGIVSFEQDDQAYTKKVAYRYRWTVALGLEESENHASEIIKITEVVAGDDANLAPEVRQDVLVDEAIFSKYRYRELKFRFSIGGRPPRDGYSRHGLPMSGWGYAFSIASMGQSNSMLFPGTHVLNIQVRKKGGFSDSDLVFLSFETTSGDLHYRHRVVLRKTPLPSNG